MSSTTYSCSTKNVHVKQQDILVLNHGLGSYELRTHLGQNSFGEDVVMPLPYSLDCHRGCKEAINDTQDSENHHEKNQKCSASLHRGREAVQNAPSVAAVPASCHARIIVVHHR